jgi:hypothetical protein
MLQSHHETRGANEAERHGQNSGTARPHCCARSLPLPEPVIGRIRQDVNTKHHSGICCLSDTFRVMCAK